MVAHLSGDVSGEDGRLGPERLGEPGPRQLVRAVNLQVSAPVHAEELEAEVADVEAVIAAADQAYTGLRLEPALRLKKQYNLILSRKKDLISCLRATDIHPPAVPDVDVPRRDDRLARIGIEDEPAAAGDVDAAEARRHGVQENRLVDHHDLVIDGELKHAVSKTIYGRISYRSIELQLSYKDSNIGAYILRS